MRDTGPVQTKNLSRNLIAAAVSSKTRVNELIVLVAAFPPRRHPRRASICQPAILAHTGQFADDQLTQFSVLHFERIGSCC
jgi:hypothetical protein